MFRVVNNEITMLRGETPTYSASFVYTDGSPYRLPEGQGSDESDPKKATYFDVQFAVKANIYDTLEEAVILKRLIINGNLTDPNVTLGTVHEFPNDAMDVITITYTGDMPQTPPDGYKGNLIRYINTSSNLVNYGY